MINFRMLGLFVLNGFAFPSYFDMKMFDFLAAHRKSSINKMDGRLPGRRTVNNSVHVLAGQYTNLFET